MNNEEQPETNDPLIVAIGGGKGGVGKSMVCANLAVQYAKAGFKVIVIDLDMGAANIHTIFGIRQPAKSLSDFFFTIRTPLTQYLIGTEVPNLQIIPGSGFVPEMANLKHSHKTKLINHIKMLKADLVLLDLGAGSSSHTIDFFSMTHAGIIVTTPEPTAIVNTYEFLKNVIYRVLFRMFKNNQEMTDILKQSIQPHEGSRLPTIASVIHQIKGKSAWTAETIKEICQEMDIHVIFNQARSALEVQLGAKLHDICEKYLNIQLNFAGMIFHSDEIPASVYEMCPISLAHPDAVPSQTLRRIAITTFNQMANKMLIGSTTGSFESQLEQVKMDAKQDFKLNLLAQKRLERQREKQRSGTLPNSVGIYDE